MSALSDYLEQKLLDFLLNAVSFTSPDVHLALYTSDPTDAGSGTEVSGGGYARVQVNANGGGAPAFALATADSPGYKVVNADAITFPTATGSWGTITHFGLLDAASAGNLLFHGALDESKTIGTDDVFEVAAGNLTLRLE